MRLAIFAASIFLTACPRPCPSRPFTDPEVAIAHHRDMRSPARVLRAEARVDRRDSEGRIRGTVLMFIERPDRVRFDAMTQFGPAAVLTSDGARFALFDRRENRFLTGPTCPENIERLLGIRFGGEEVTRLLLGETPMIEGERAMRCENGGYVVTIRGADGSVQELVLEVRDQDLDAAPDDQRLRLRRSELHQPDGSLAWRVSYDDYQLVQDPGGEGRSVAMPFTVRFEDPRRGADTLVRFQDVDLNVEVPEDAFVQTQVPGVQAEEVGCE